ncbi:hypothetical protein KEM52_000049 [Ascosphaera acerosa]|nr:hypothetical protein KEM52_000049 [Ascosphaera acerosa]
MPVLCRICERQITPWWFEKHTELCISEHKAEMDVQIAHEALSEHRRAIVKVLDAYWCKSTLILDLCDTALEINVPTLKATMTYESGDGLHFRTDSPQSDSRIVQVLQWQSPNSNTLEQEAGLAELANDTEVAARAKVDAVRHHRRIIEYAERIRVEFAVLIDQCITAAIHKAEKIANGELSDSSDSASLDGSDSHEGSVIAEKEERARIQDQEWQDQWRVPASGRHTPNDPEAYEGEIAQAVGDLALHNTELALSASDQGQDTSVEVPVSRPVSMSSRLSQAFSVPQSVSPMGADPMPSRTVTSSPLPRSYATLSLSPSPVGFRSHANSISKASGIVSAPAIATTQTASRSAIISDSMCASDRNRRSSSIISTARSPSPFDCATPRSQPPSGTTYLKSLSRPQSRKTKRPELDTSPGTVPADAQLIDITPPLPAVPISPRLAASNYPPQKAVAPSIKDFEIIKPISKGAFGSVFLSRKKATGEYFAIKVLKKADMVAKNQITNVKAERAIMMWQGESEFVAKLYWTFSSKEYLYLVMEYLNGGDCASLIKSLGGLPEDWAKNNSAGSDSLSFLFRNQSVSHLEESPFQQALSHAGDDELYNDGGNSPMIQPLNRSMSVSSSTSQYGTPPQAPSSIPPPPMALFDAADHGRGFVGTPDYLAPETIKGSGQDEMCDWWSLGCILFEFLFGYPPFNAATPNEVFDNILHRRIHWPEEADEMVTSEARDLMNRLMTTDPGERLGSNRDEIYKNGGEEVRAHPWFTDINWTTLLEDKAQFTPAPENPEDTEYFDSRGATLQSFQEELDDAPSPTLPAAEYQDRPHDALAKIKSSQGSSKRGLLPLSIPPHVRERQSRRHSECGAADDFGNFTFKNLPVLEKANKDVIQKLKQEALQTQQRQYTNATNPTIGPSSVESSPLLSSSAKRTIAINKRSVSPSAYSQATSASPNPRAKALLKVQRRRQSSRRLSQLNLDPGPHFRSLDVLICEDHPVSRIVMERLFEKLRCRTITAVNGAEALRYALSEVQFDVIMTEFKLAQISGHDLARMIRETKSPNTHTPIVAVTGYLKDFPETHNFDALIEKPPTIMKITETVGKLCNWKPPPKDLDFSLPPLASPALRQTFVRGDNDLSTVCPTNLATSARDLDRADSVGSRSSYSYFTDVELAKSDEPAMPGAVGISRRHTEDWDTSPSLHGLGVSQLLNSTPLTDQSKSPGILMQTTTSSQAAPSSQQIPFALSPDAAPRNGDLDLMLSKRHSSETSQPPQTPIRTTAMSPLGGRDRMPMAELTLSDARGEIHSKASSPKRCHRPASKLGVQMLRTNSHGSVVSAGEELDKTSIAGDGEGVQARHKEPAMLDGRKDSLPSDHRLASVHENQVLQTETRQADATLLPVQTTPPHARHPSDSNASLPDLDKEKTPTALTPRLLAIDTGVVDRAAHAEYDVTPRSASAAGDTDSRPATSHMPDSNEVSLTEWPDLESWSPVRY